MAGGNELSRDKVIEALFHQIDTLTDRIASADAAIGALLRQKGDMFQAIRNGQQVIEHQALYIQELHAALDQAIIL